MGGYLCIIYALTMSVASSTCNQMGSTMCYSLELLLWRERESKPLPWLALVVSEAK